MQSSDLQQRAASAQHLSEQRAARARVERELAQRRVELAEARAALRRERLRRELDQVHGIDPKDEDLRWFEHAVRLAHLRVVHGELDLSSGAGA